MHSLVSDDQRDEIARGFLDAGVKHLHGVAADGVHLRVKFHSEHTVIKIDKACAGVAPNNSTAVLCRFQNLEIRPGRRNAVAAESIAAGIENLLDGGWYVENRTGCPHGSEHFADADCIPDLEGPKLPAKSPPHRAIDVVNRVRDIGCDPCSVDERWTQRGAKKSPGLPLVLKQDL